MKLGKIIAISFLAISLQARIQLFSQNNIDSSFLSQPLNLKEVNTRTKFQDHYTAKLLRAEQDWQGESKEYISRFDSIVNIGAKNKIEGKITRWKALKLLYRLKEPIEHVFPEFEKTLFILEAYKKGKADCDILGYHYAAAAHQAGLETVPVIVKGKVEQGDSLVEQYHFFLQVPLSNGHSLNWDPVNGEEVSDMRYMTKFNTSTKPVNKNSDFINGEDEILKIAFSNYLFAVNSIDNTSDITSKYSKLALEYDPFDYNVLLSAANTAFHRQEYDLSFEIALRAAYTFPEEELFYSYAGNSALRKAKPDLVMAKSIAKSMIEKFPNNSEGYFLNASISKLEHNKELVNLYSAKAWSLDNKE